MIKRSKPSFSTKDPKPGIETRRCNIGGHIPQLHGPKEESQVSGVPTCLQRILSFTSGHLSPHDKSFVKVYLANGTVNVVRCMDDTRVQEVIDHVVEQLGAGQKSQKYLYSLVAVCGATKAQHWLHRDMSMSECHRELLSVYEVDDWRFELKIRFFLKSRLDLLLNDRIAFDYLFDQVKNDFKMSSIYETLDRDTAVELGSIEIRMVLRDKHPKTPGKKISNTVLEEVDWKKFLPKTLSQGSEAKLLFKSIQKVLKSYLVVSEEECILKYFDIVSAIWRFDTETFNSFLGDHPSPPLVRVTVAQAINITHENESVSIPLLSFEHVESISLSVESDKDVGQLTVSLSSGQTPLTIRCSSAVQAKQLASLIDGNCFLLSAGKRGVWSPSSDGKTSLRMTKLTELQKQNKTDDAPDYAILEEDVGNTKSPLINRSINCHPVCSCSKATEVSSPLSPFASTPDLLSNARSTKFRPGICPQDASSCGSSSVMDKVAIGHPSISLCNVSVSGQADRPAVVSKLTHEVIEQKLRLQKQQSDDDAEWLHREEAKLILGENRVTSPKKIDECDVLNASKIHCDGTPKKAAESSNIPVDLLHQVKADRTTDPLYCATTTLVQGIVDLNGSVQQGHTESLVGSAKSVGVQLKALLNVVHLESSGLPSETQDEIEMAQKTLNSDLVHIIDAMKMVIRYSPTELAQDYRRRMLQLGHALAIDAKTLFDTVDLGRKKKILSAGLGNSQSVTDVTNQISSVSLQSSDLHSKDQLKISQTSDSKL